MTAGGATVRRLTSSDGRHRIQLRHGRHDLEVSRFVATCYSRVPHFVFDSVEQLTAEIAAEDHALVGSSTVAVARDRSGGIVSTVRLIERAETLLPVERALGVRVTPADSGSGQVFELARLVSHRRAPWGLIWQLAIALDEYRAIDSCRDAVVAGIDVSLFRALTRRGWPLVPLGPPRFHLGSATMPITVDMVGVRAVLAAHGHYGERP